MKIFLDTADIKEIEKAAKTGLIDGVTTNPSLVAKTGMKFEDVVKRICELVDGPISAEVTALTADEMVSQGKDLAKIHDNVVVKLPLIPEGLLACKKLSAENIATNVTLCFSSVQAMLAAKAGATYVSPFVGRLDDIGENGMDLIATIRHLYDNYGYQTQILVASVRHVQHVYSSLEIGADVATMPYNVFEKLAHHPLTESGLARFMKDWENAIK